VNQYEPKEKCIREQVGRNTKRVNKRQRLEPNREREEKGRGEGDRKKGKEEGRRGNQNPQEGQDLFIVYSSKRTAGITHSQIESSLKVWNQMS
jgi:hypothetical protein